MLTLDSTFLNGERGNLAKESKFTLVGCQRDLPFSVDCTEDLGNYVKQVSSSCSDFPCLHALFSSVITQTEIPGYIISSVLVSS